MKKVAVLLAVVVAITLILHPVTRRVNLSHQITTLDRSALQADGGPLPPPWPPGGGGHVISTLIADGGPLPPPWPPGGGGHIFIA
jgi:hypothetical protein